MEEKNFYIDITPLFLGDGNEKEFSFDFTPDIFDGSVKLSSPIVCSGRVYERANARGGAQNYIELCITLSGKYTTECARCLRELEMPLETEASFCVVNKEKTDDNDSILFAPEGKLNLTEVADDLFFMELPSKHLCMPDCKGLCQKCGKDLNLGACGCNEKNIDPRLAVLKKLLDK